MYLYNEHCKTLVLIGVPNNVCDSSVDARMTSSSGVHVSSIWNGGTSAVLDGANSLPIVLFKKWGKSLGIKMEFFETALVLD